MGNKGTPTSGARVVNRLVTAGEQQTYVSDIGIRGSDLTIGVLPVPHSHGHLC